MISSFTDDTEVNMDREFTITLSSPNPALADILDITVPTATVIIEDNDGAAADLGNAIQWGEGRGEGGPKGLVSPKKLFLMILSRKKMG